MARFLKVHPDTNVAYNRDNCYDETRKKRLRLRFHNSIGSFLPWSRKILPKQLCNHSGVEVGLNFCNNVVSKSQDPTTTMVESHAILRSS